MADLKKFCWGGDVAVLTKRARSARRPAEGQSFKGTPPKIFLKFTLKSMHIKTDFSNFFLFIIAFISLAH